LTEPDVCTETAGKAWLPQSGKMSFKITKLLSHYYKMYYKMNIKMLLQNVLQTEHQNIITKCITKCITILQYVKMSKMSKDKMSKDKMSKYVRILKMLNYLASPLLIAHRLQEKSSLYGTWLTWRPGSKFLPSQHFKN
jgi:hypothetical protein